MRTQWSLSGCFTFLFCKISESVKRFLENQSSVRYFVGHQKSWSFSR